MRNLGVDDVAMLVDSDLNRDGARASGSRLGPTPERQTGADTGAQVYFVEITTPGSKIVVE